MNSKSAFLVPFDAPSLLLIGLMCHFIFPGFFVEKVTASVAKRLGAHSFTARSSPTSRAINDMVSVKWSPSLPSWHEAYSVDSLSIFDSTDDILSS